MSCFCFISVLHKCFLFILLKFFLFHFYSMISMLQCFQTFSIIFVLCDNVTKKKNKGITLTFYFLLVFYITFNFMQKQKVVWVTTGIHGRSEENQVNYISYVLFSSKLTNYFPQKIWSSVNIFRWFMLQFVKLHCFSVFYFLKYFHCMYW